MIRFVPVLLVMFAAATRGDTNAMVAQAFSKCTEQFPLSDNDMERLKGKSDVPDSKNAKCTMACMMKEGKMISDGVYSSSNALLMADVLNKDNPDMAEKAKMVVENCTHKVGTDVGPDECEFAYKMAVCADGEAKKLGVLRPDF